MTLYNKEDVTIKASSWMLRQHFHVSGGGFKSRLWMRPAHDAKPCQTVSISQFLAFFSVPRACHLPRTRSSIPWIALSTNGKSPYVRLRLVAPPGQCGGGLDGTGGRQVPVKLPGWSCCGCRRGQTETTARTRWALPLVPLFSLARPALYNSSPGARS